MRSLPGILQLLNTEEKKEFKSFLLKTGRIDHRKDLILFNKLQKEGASNSRNEFFGLYTKSDRNAYHSLRKRLVRQLERYIISRASESNPTKEDSIEHLLGVARFALNRDTPMLASHYLDIAQSHAERQSQWELLDQVYRIKIVNFMVLGEKLDTLLKNWEDNKKRIALSEKMLVAHSLIQEKLNDARLSGTTLNLQEITSLTLRKFHIENEAWSQPEFMLTVASMLRSAVISTREYYHFESYVRRMYRELNKQESFAGKFQVIEVNFLYMIAHVLYRNRKFTDCAQHLEKMVLVMSHNKKMLSGIFNARYILLKAALESYTNHNEMAIERLKSALRKSQSSFPIAARLNMLLNLSVYYFQAENYKLSNKIMLSIQHSDKWLEKKMGPEWNFKKNLIHIILQYELGHDDIAWQMTRSIEKRYSLFLQHPFYQRASIFIGFIKFLISEPEKARTKKFMEEVNNANIALPGDREDIQAMTFFCWLKSKMTGEKYYKVLLEMIGQSNETS